MISKEVRKLTGEEQLMVVENINLAYYLKNKWIEKLGNKYDYDELESSCLVGLVKAAKGFDGSKNVKFATYASKCIDNEVLMYLRTARRHSVVLSLEEIIAFDIEGNNLSLKDIVSTGEFEDQVISGIYLSHKLQECVVETRDKEILRLLGDGKTQKQIGETLEMSQSYVSRLIKGLKKAIMTEEPIKKKKYTRKPKDGEQKLNELLNQVKGIR